MRTLVLCLGFLVLGVLQGGCYTAKIASKADCERMKDCAWNSEKHECECSNLRGQPGPPFNADGRGR